MIQLILARSNGMDFLSIDCSWRRRMDACDFWNRFIYFDKTYFIPQTRSL